MSNEDINDKALAYNTPDFSLKMPDMSKLGDAMPVRAGASAPDFEAPALDGRVVRPSELKGRRHVVLMMGAITSPMCSIAVPAMNRLDAQFADKEVDFYLLYAKESHPGERYRHHSSMELPNVWWNTKPTRRCIIACTNARVPRHSRTTGRYSQSCAVAGRDVLAVLSVRP
ncbi:MAG: redoxin domain-containing protein [Betaproteobacteria bacterium]|nr:redoxin domain-containing protein [Betaproteobacteria bacterium]